MVETDKRKNDAPDNEKVEKKPEYIKIKKGATHDKVVTAITKAKLEKKLSS